MLVGLFGYKSVFRLRADQMYIVEGALIGPEREIVGILAGIILPDLRELHRMLKLLHRSACILKDIGSGLVIRIQEVDVRHQKVAEHSDVRHSVRAHAGDLLGDMSDDVGHVEEGAASGTTGNACQQIDVEGFHLIAGDQLADGSADRLDDVVHFKKEHRSSCLPDPAGTVLSGQRRDSRIEPPVNIRIARAVVISDRGIQKYGEAAVRQNDQLIVIERDLAGRFAGFLFFLILGRVKRQISHSVGRDVLVFIRAAVLVDQALRLTEHVCAGASERNYKISYFGCCLHFGKRYSGLAPVDREILDLFHCLL